MADSTSFDEQTEKIDIYLRVKKAENCEDLYKINNNEIRCCIQNASTSRQTNIEPVTKKYTFTHIFGPNSTQEEIFNLIIKPKIVKFINGYNTTFMTYGSSGSGKTYTIMGTPTHPGIIPRTLEYLFRTLPSVQEIPLAKPTESGNVELIDQTCSQAELKLRNKLLRSATAAIGENHITTFKAMKSHISVDSEVLLDSRPGIILNVWISFAELYNENIYDLLTPQEESGTSSRQKLRLVSIKENTYIKNLTSVSISSDIEAYQILLYGLHKVAYAPTAVNDRSSRSHCVFTIKIAQMMESGSACRLHYFNFCDLAGSERLKKTLNVDIRLKESNIINTSLLVLGRCISSIRETQKTKVKKPIPFRDSKLTTLFQKGLSGKESFSMIVNMNASYAMYEESQHALDFSALAKDIVVNKCSLLAKIKEREFPECPQASSTAYVNEKDIPGKPTKLRENLENKMIDLYDELTCASNNMIHVEDRVREDMNYHYGIILNNFKERLQKDFECARKEHKKILEMMKASYENNQINDDDDEIIVISSSDEAEEEEEDIICRSLELQNDQINDGADEIFVTSSSNELEKKEEDIKCKLLELQNELVSKNEKIEKLKKTLEDHKKVSQEEDTKCQREMEGLLNKNIALFEENTDLIKYKQEFLLRLS